MAGKRSRRASSIRRFTIELLVYAALVVGYFLLVLHFLEPWVAGVFERARTAYAFVALGLIVAQGILLETVTSILLRIFERR